MNALLGLVLVWAGGFTPFTPAPPCAGMPTNTPHARAAVIRCVAEHYGVNPDKALRVARCESYDALRARLEDDGNLGVFQMRERYWDERWRRYGEPLGLPNRPLSVLVNAHVALAMVKDYGGWSHWSCGEA